MYYDFVIIGGGIIGLTIAKTLKEKFSDSNILILEKEEEIAKHASGRNSGVLHSGIYYATETLKAKLCALGARKMVDWCNENAVVCEEVGKVIIPTEEEHDEYLDILLERAKTNGVVAYLVDNIDLAKIEPFAYSVSGRSLYSPNTSIVCPTSVCSALYNQLVSKGVKILFNQKVSYVSNRLAANNEEINYGLLINSAGAYADKIAKSFGCGEHYTFLPFRGSYYLLSSDIRINGLIYPVPDLNYPFLGIHFTKAINGRVYLGPNAMPAFGRENYNGINGIEFGDVFNIFFHLAKQYISNKNSFRKFAHREIMNLSRKTVSREASKMVPSLRPIHIKPSSKVGIRPQLLDLRTNQLVMDFVVEKAKNSIHILNAISPAFTSSFAFAEYIVEHFV